MAFLSVHQAGWVAVLITTLAFAPVAVAKPSGAAFTAVGTPAPAATPGPRLTATSEAGFDVAGITSNGEFLNPANTVAYIQLAPFALVTAINFDVNLTAFDPSWLSELSVVFTDSGINAGVQSAPGFAAQNAGTQSFVGGGNLLDQGLSFMVGADGRLRLEFADAFNDPEVNPDGRWNSGRLTFTFVATPVPEPSMAVLLGLGLTGLTMFRRQRQGRR